MLVRLRRDGFNAALPFAQLALIVFALRADTGWGSVLALALLLATGLFGWLRSVRHARLILDTPTSRIASAAQGYTELRGRGHPLDGTPVLSPLNGLPLLWYRLSVYRKTSDGKWRHAETRESDASFLLDDGSGVCAVDPEGAEMLVRRRDVSERGDLRQIQWSLLKNDPVYVLGDFFTLGSISPDLDISRQVRELLAHWKSNQPELLKRFDLDGNGSIDLQEWELARAQARREVLRQRDEILTAPEAHVIRKPQQRLYLISDLDPQALARRYRRWSIFHLAVFLGAAGATAWLHQIGVF
ncbi:MAG: hypothetical protein C0607_00415 [Azoarcus sp.]|uniref:EF-hand domain-containing protein n=1 Tax=Parazoarcus communis TaxID=41977 RepID=A0A2U8GPK1_9RHOO|nr:hypothetical protein [Parazoarcus communis]AWI75572.1 hypothetical protein CEW83_10385 [Parazoarcus communis]PLX77828.1 MAG: hypothetical protein C0607_00415 [Azoarcus sp.]TVT57246.1 MAG: hypothetical protein FHK80_10735 [Azoarcus sp. PHD]|tara:strand:+ start:5974 stop:6873 length:900 start_codon:yes stop_codon:yes gene_type:complete